MKILRYYHEGQPFNGIRDLTLKRKCVAQKICTLRKQNYHCIIKYKQM